MTFSDMGMAYQYAASLHWAIAHITLGSVDIVPHNTMERGVTITFLLVGLLGGSTLVSLLSSTMVELQALAWAHLHGQSATLSLLGARAVCPWPHRSKRRMCRERGPVSHGLGHPGHREEREHACCWRGREAVLHLPGSPMWRCTAWDPDAVELQRPRKRPAGRDSPERGAAERPSDQAGAAVQDIALRRAGTGRVAWTASLLGTTRSSGRAQQRAGRRSRPCGGHPAPTCARGGDASWLGCDLGGALCCRGRARDQYI